MFTRVFVFLSLLVAGLARAGVTPAVTAADLDAARCEAFEGARSLGAAPAGVVERLLGLTPAESFPAWSTGPVTGSLRHFRLAFGKPVALGTICTEYAGGGSLALFQTQVGTSVSYLKADAPYPGDVANDTQWVRLPAGEVKTLPTGTTTGLSTSSR